MGPANALLLYDALAGDRLSFLYSGLFHDDHTARLIALGDEFFQDEEADKSLRGKLAFVMVEAYQNIVRHRTVASDLQSVDRGRSLFLLRCGERRHSITAINALRKEEADRLNNTLKGMVGLGSGQMKEAYLRGLQSEERTERGGAGLGLIEMTRRSGHPLRWAFSTLEDGRSLVALQALIGRSASWSDPATKAFDLQELVVEHDIAVACRGVFSPGELEVLMRIIERDLDADHVRSNARVRAFLALTEIMPRIPTLGEGPMIVMSRQRDVISLSLAAPLSAPVAAELARTVAEVKAMTDQEKQRIYRDILLGRSEGSASGKLGLIDLARCSGGAISIETIPRQAGAFIVLRADL